MIHRNIIEKYGSLLAGTTYRSSNNSDFNLSLNSGDINSSINNRKTLFNTLGLSIDKTIFPQQTHSNNIIIVSQSDIGRGSCQSETSIPNCDGLITHSINTILCIQTADCFPIFIYDPINKVIANLHAGWRGTHSKIVIKSIEILQVEFQSKPNELFLSFGPGIQYKQYEVSEDFRENFSKDVLYEIDNRLCLDLIKENTQQALHCGLDKNKIFTESSLCTASHLDKFYSYRKEGKKSERMISFIALK